ncbi:hypothetical protein BS17DRAFT_365225 [Gyrodon lividus]|nr:hypothetical protein BS17DRAFT_365225 [Gyrodon lividus]
MSRYRDYRSPRGVHVDTNFDQDLDDYAASPHRNRYSRPNQTPRISDVTWLSGSAPQHSASPTPQTLHTHTQRIPSPQAPSLPQLANLPTPVIGRAQPSPAPTEHEIAEHMVPDDLYGQYQDVDPYRPHPKGSGARLMKGFLQGLKKIPGFHTQRLTRIGSYETVQAPEPGLSVQSLSLRYGNPTPPATEPQRVSTPYTSPYVRPVSASGTPAVVPPSLRAPSPAQPLAMPPPIIVSPPLTAPLQLPGSATTPSVAASPAMGGHQSLHPRADQLTQEDGSQTLHDPVRHTAPVHPVLYPQSVLIQMPQEQQEPSYGPRVEFLSPMDSPSKSSLASTVARFRRFVAGLDQLPWVSEDQIADEYIPSQTHRSRQREKIRNRSEPSWYNSHPEIIQQPMYWQSEWDLFAKQSAATLLNGNGRYTADPGWSGSGHGHGEHGRVNYPHGYVPAQPVFVYPSGFPPPGQFADPVPR